MIEDIKFFTTMKCDCGYTTHSFFKLLFHLWKYDKSKITWKNIWYSFTHSIEIFPLYFIIAFVVALVLNTIKLICFPFWKTFEIIKNI